MDMSAENPPRGSGPSQADSRVAIAPRAKCKAMKRAVLCNGGNSKRRGLDMTILKTLIEGLAFLFALGGAIFLVVVL